MKLALLALGPLCALACSGPGSAGTTGGACAGLAHGCVGNANCCSGLFCDHGRCAFGSPPSTSGGGAGGSTGNVQGTTCQSPNVLCDGACIPVSQCGVNAGGNGGTGGGTGTTGATTGGGTGTSGAEAVCPVDGGAAGAGCTLFTAPLQVAAAGAVEALALGDLNGDGAADVVAATAGGLFAYLGDGCGGFAPPLGLAGGAWQSVALGAFRAGGSPDVAAVGGGKVDLFPNRGAALFSDGGAVPDGTLPVALAVADVNGDGRPDLVVLDRSDCTVAFLLGNGDGTFQPPSAWLACADAADAGWSFASLAVTDLDGDGRPDVATTDAAENALVVLLQTDGGFAAPVLHPTQGSAPASVAAADVDGDGRADVLVGTQGASGVAPTLELFRDADGGFAPPVSFVTASAPGQLAAASLRTGVLPDALLADPADGAVQLFLNDGSGRLGTPQLCPAVPGAIALAVGDLNGDGKPDAVVGGGGDAGAIAVLLNVSR